MKLEVVYICVQVYGICQFNVVQLPMIVLYLSMSVQVYTMNLRVIFV